MSVFTDSRLPGAAPYHALGLWHPTGKLGSAAYFPSPSERRILHGKSRFQYAFNFAAVPAGQVANDRVTVMSDFYWTDTIASSAFSGGAFNVAGSISLFETKGKQRYSNLTLFLGNFADFGFTIIQGAPITGALPFFERRITKIAKGSVLLMRLQNSSTGSETVQVVLGGYID